MIIYYKNNDEFKSTEINPWSSFLQTDESILWSYQKKSGIINKHVTETFNITNFRIFSWSFKTNRNIGLLLLQELDDVIVMNTSRSYNSVHYGAYSSLARGFGVTGGQSSGTSVTIGDIVFFSDGKPVITWQGVSDPHGLRRLVQATKKMLYPTKELQRFLTGVKDDNLSIIRNVSVCLRCGTKNVKDASFCSTCGNILK
ncbi:MAG: zinc ribbon domain-containing protein [Nitrososphaera sp.]|jgi:hypothetical protein